MRQVLTPGQTRAVAFAAVMLVGLALRVATAIHFSNINHSDEIFQYLEPAHRLVFGYGLIDPIFQHDRSWVMPGLLAAIIKAASVWSDDPAVYIGAVGIVMSLLSLTLVAIAFLWGLRLYGTMGAIVTGSVAATWIELVYFAPHPLTDTLAADAMVAAVYVVYPETDLRPRRAFAACGLLLGVAFAIRWQLAPIYLLITLWVCRGFIKNRWLPFAIGVGVPVLALGVLDAVTRDYPFQSVLAPFLLHYVAGEPWYYYLGVLTLNWSGAIVLVLGLACLGARRLPLLAVVVVATLLVHSLHVTRVYRYIYPALPFLFVLVGIGASDMVDRLSSGHPARRRALAAVAVGSAVLTSAALAVGENFRVYLNKDGALTMAFATVGKEADLCGLAVTGIDWWRLPGYTYLHRDIPIYLLPAAEIGRPSQSFNYLVSFSGLDRDPPKAAAVPGFSRQRCFTNAGFHADTAGKVCIYHRSGNCVPSAESAVKNRLVDEFSRIRGKGQARARPG
jgi:phosphatidylinositol glycan class B